MADVSFVCNSFTDVNYVAPILGVMRDRGQKAVVIFHLTDLKRPTKIFFREWADRIQRLSEFSEHEIVSTDTISQLKKALRSSNSIFVTTSPTAFQLLEKNVLPHSIFGSKQYSLLVLDYFREFTEHIQAEASMVWLSSPFWAGGLGESKSVQYGLPYWDIFSRGSFQDRLEQLSLDTQKKKILIPEIMLDGNSWFEACYKYINLHKSSNTRFYLKYRLKTPEDVARSKKLDERLLGMADVIPIYSPLYCDTAALLNTVDTVVFTSNATLMSIDCIVAGCAVEMAYQESRSGLWNSDIDTDAARALEMYQCDPKSARDFFASHIGQSTNRFLRVLETF